MTIIGGASLRADTDLPVSDFECDLGFLSLLIGDLFVSNIKLGLLMHLELRELRECLDLEDLPGDFYVVTNAEAFLL